MAVHLIPHSTHHHHHQEEQEEQEEQEGQQQDLHITVINREAPSHLHISRRTIQSSLISLTQLSPYPSQLHHLSTPAQDSLSHPSSHNVFAHLSQLHVRPPLLIVVAG